MMLQYDDNTNGQKERDMSSEPKPYADSPHPSNSNAQTSNSNARPSDSHAQTSLPGSVSRDLLDGASAWLGSERAILSLL
jgi:hypothetical protein